MRSASVNKFRFFTSMIVWSGVLVFGIAFLTIFLILDQPIPENYVETQGTITRIEEELSATYDETDGIGVEDYDHRVFVSYSFNGETYQEKEYGRYSSSMKKGDTVLLYVNPDDPSEFLSDRSDNFVFVIIGIIIIVAGACGIGYNVYKKKKENK